MTSKKNNEAVVREDIILRMQLIRKLKSAEGCLSAKAVTLHDADNPDDPFRNVPRISVGKLIMPQPGSWAGITLNHSLAFLGVRSLL